MVKLTLATAIIVLVTLSAVHPIQGQGSCGSGIRVRKEIKTLAASERSALSTALNTLYRNGVVRKYADMHRQMQSQAHGTPGFLVRHRLMVKMFEDELIAASEGRLSGLPYWDTTQDARNPGSSVVLTPDYMGTADQGCVQNGPAANWRLADGSCVERGFRPGSWISTSVVNGLISGVRSYTALSRTLEGGMHVHPHANIGPTMANVMISPWDPLFWMHHCGVDYWWAQWEAAGNAGSYDGPSVSMGNFGHSDAVDYQNRLCYRYDSIRIQNPPFSSSSANPSSTSANSQSTSSAVSSATPTSTATNPQPETPTATPAPTSNQTDIVVPDFSTIPDDILQSFNLTREGVNQLDPIIKTVAAYLKHLKDQGKPLPTIETLKQFKLPKNIENAINAESPPPEEKSDAMASDISLLCQSVWFTIIAILTFTL